MIAWLLLFIGGGLACCLALGWHRNRVPEDVDAWRYQLRARASRALAALELQVMADRAMAQDSLRRAVCARDRRGFEEAIRLVDIAFDVLTDAYEDRRARLRGMALCLRMLSAVEPLPALTSAPLQIRQLRGVTALAHGAHHVLVSAGERLMLRLILLRWGYSLCWRVLMRSRADIRCAPEALTAWARWTDTVSDWMGVLDPAHVEAYRALLVTASAKVAS